MTRLHRLKFLTIDRLRRGFKLHGESTAPEESSSHSAWLESVAQGISERGLATAAILLLEMHRPVVGLAGSATLVVAPFLKLVAPQTTIQHLQWLFESDTRIETLILRLENHQLPSSTTSKVGEVS